MTFKQITSFLVLATLAFSSQLFAAGNYSGPNRDASGNIFPTPKGENCVEETSYMRKNHMDLLLHKRDQTMRKGIRTEKHSLTECINCHATPDENGKIARVTEDGSKHFCSTCHVAAAVKLDCFECHADRPVSSFMKSALKNKSNHDLFNIIKKRENFNPQASKNIPLNNQKDNL